MAGQNACGPGAVAWIEAYLGDCVYDARDLLGFCLGMASICCWMVAQLPQLYKNYRTQHAEALSAAFLASWLLGDTCNLVGALLKGDQPPTLVFTAQYFISVDCVMMVQYIYLTSLQRRRERMLATRRHRTHHHHHHHRRRHDGVQPEPGGSGEPGGGSEQTWSSDRASRRDAGAAANGHGGSDAEISGVGDRSAQLPGADVPSRPQRALACLGALLLVARLQPRQQPGEQAGLGGRRLLATAGAGGFLAHLPAWAYDVGTALGYCSSVLYLTSRLSQIYKNWQRRSVEGLAISMFVTAVAANSLYGASILLRSRTLPELLSSLPWLLGSLGTVALDFTIFAQSRAYGHAAGKQHPSDEDEPLLPPATP